jgi:hypothetical protein
MSSQLPQSSNERQIGWIIGAWIEVQVAGQQLRLRLGGGSHQPHRRAVDGDVSSDPGHLDGPTDGLYALPQLGFYDLVPGKAMKKFWAAMLVLIRLHKEGRFYPSRSRQTQGALYFSSAG